MKKSPIIYVIVLLVVLLPVVSARASVVGDLTAAEGQYKARQYTQAEQSYLTLTQQGDRNTGEEADPAFAACKKLPLVYIATDRLPEARDAVQQLLSRYAGYEFLPHAIHEIVEGAEALLKLAQVRQLFLDMVTAQPGDSQALWLKMGMAIASVHLAEDKAVDAVVRDIITQHGADDRASEALNHIAWAYRKLGRYSEALTIYQYVVNNWPQKDRVVFAQQGIAICQLRLGDRQAADEALQVMLQKFGTDQNASKLLAWAVFEYLQAGETDGAYKVFDLVLQTYPEKAETIEALLSLATAAIQGNDRDRIEPTVQTLLTRFAPTEAKASTLHVVANMLGWKCRDYGNQPLEEQSPPGICNKCLLAIANYTLATWPKSDWAMWAERDLATAAIHRGDTPTAEAAISRLSTDYADRKDTPEALNFLADYCLQLGKHSEAEAVYQQVVKEYPTHDLILLAKVGLGVTQLHEGNDVGAEAIFQKALADDPNHPRIAQAFHLMGMGYYERAIVRWKQAGTESLDDGSLGPIMPPEPVAQDFQKAVAKWEIVINQLPSTALVTPAACLYSGVCGSYLGEYDKAVLLFQKVADDYPDFRDADYASLMVARNLERLAGDRGLSQDETDELAKPAYHQLVERFPDSPYARIARHALDRIDRRTLSTGE